MNINLNCGSWAIRKKWKKPSLSSQFYISALIIGKEALDISDPDIVMYITQTVSVTGSQPAQARHHFEFYKWKAT